MGEVGYDEELHVAGNMVTWRKEVKARQWLFIKHLQLIVFSTGESIGI